MTFKLRQIVKVCCEIKSLNFFKLISPLEFREGFFYGFPFII